MYYLIQIALAVTGVIGYVFLFGVLIWYFIFYEPGRRDAKKIIRVPLVFFTYLIIFMLYAITLFWHALMIQSSIYKHTQTHTHAPRRRRLEILEIGTGAQGSGARYLKDNSVIHLDISKSAQDLEIQADALALPFKDNSFDVVYASHVLEHVPRPPDFLKEIGRVARHKVIIKVPGTMLTPNEYPGHIYSWNPRTLENLLSKVFRVTYVRTNRRVYTYSQFRGLSRIKRIWRYLQYMIFQGLRGSSEITAICYKGPINSSSTRSLSK